MSTVFPQLAVGDWITAAARKWPNLPCFVSPEGILTDVPGARRPTFHEVNERVTRLAHALVDRGFVRGDKVAILAVDSIEHIEVILACAKAGITYCDLNFRMRALELANVLKRNPVRGIFYSSRYQELLDQIEGEVPHIELRCIIDGEEREQFNTLVNSSDDTSEMVAQCRNEDILSIMFTSGTTSVPKGVMQSERMLRNITYIYHREFRLTPGGVQYSGASLFHISGISSIFHALYGGRASLVLPQFDAHAVLHWLQHGGINSCTLIPTMINSILELPGAMEHNYSDLDYLLYGGAATPPALIKRMAMAFDCDLYNGLGAGTEAGLQVMLTADDHRAAIGGKEILFSSIGKPILGVDLRLCDENLNDVPVGEIGEIVTRSETIMSGYLDQPDLTARSVVDGWFRAGDMAQMDADGYLYLAARKADMIIRGGENVYPVEIESTLAEHPAVLEVSVIGIEDEHWGEIVGAAIVLRPGASATVDELRALCRERLASYKVPERIHFFDELPKNSTNKLMKSAITTLVRQREDAQK